MKHGHKAVFLPDMHLRTRPTDRVKRGWTPIVSPALHTALEFCEDFKPDTTIIGGDMLDLPEISKHTERKKIEREKLRLNHTFELGNQILDRVDKFTGGEVVYEKGNHEGWLDLWVEENPAVEGLVSLEKNLRLVERGYKIIHENRAYKLGHAKFIHGWFTRDYHSKPTVNRMGDNVFYGHAHDVQAYTNVNYDSQPLMGYSVGCLCDLNPGWLRKRPNNWVNGFGVFYFSKDGSFTFYNPIIIRGGFWYAGKYYNGGKQ